ncbi:unnamed protein product [Lampetra fluviatilis]
MGLIARRRCEVAASGPFDAKRGAILTDVCDGHAGDVFATLQKQTNHVVTATRPFVHCTQGRLAAGSAASLGSGGVGAIERTGGAAAPGHTGWSSPERDDDATEEPPAALAAGFVQSFAAPTEQLAMPWPLLPMGGRL